MKLSLIKKSVLGLFISCLVLGLSTSLKAAESDTIAGLIVSPPLIEKEVNPGNNFTGNVKVTNPNSTSSLLVEVSVRDFKANGENGEQTFVDPDEGNSYTLGAWVTITQSFELKPNEIKDVPYTVNIPANAEPGGHYGVIFFSPKTKAESATGGSGVTAIPKVGSLLLFTVPGDINYSGNIKEFSINKSFFTNSLNKLNFSTRFENTGSNHIKPQGDIVIKNILGREVAKLTVNEKMGNILPNSIRKFDNEWEKKYGFGMYKASLTLAYGDNGAASSELSFWIVPWKETTGAVVLLVLLIWILSHLKWSGKKSDPQPVVNQAPVQPQAPIAQSQPTIPQPQSPVDQFAGPVVQNQQPSENTNTTTESQPPIN